MKKKYQVIMENNDDGGRREVEKIGTLAECRKYLLLTLEELKEEDGDVEIYTHDKDSIEGEGNRGEFKYYIC